MSENPETEGQGPDFERKLRRRQARDTPHRGVLDP
jgi:hypothetical protein